MSERSRTEENLHTAYEAEAKASIRLLAFAEKAEQEGYAQMAHLFRAIAAGEQVHAISHLRHLKAVGSTEENLEKSFSNETDVATAAYKTFIAQAEEDGHKAARISFTHARDAEEYHGKLYKAAMEAMLEEKDTDFFVCTVCGYVASNQAPETCPVCQAPAERFRPVA